MTLNITEILQKKKSYITEDIILHIINLLMNVPK